MEKGVIAFGDIKQPSTAYEVYARTWATQAAKLPEGK